MRGTRMTTVGVYERRVRASVERIWEALLDWESLPTLHREDYASARRIESGDWGWTARVRGPGAPDAREMTLQLVIDRQELRAVLATIDGPGKGSEIRTGLEPDGPHETRLRVEFLVPDVSPERAAALAQAYRTLSTRQWDRNEAVMLRREKLLARPQKPGPARLDLGPIDDLRAKLPRVVELAGRPWRIVELDGALVVHAGVCPHSQGPLEETVVENGVIECPWHGYRFDLRTGTSCDGRGLRLSTPPRLEITQDLRAILIF
jgi:nitrite reductase/ring-hydroxylating ferredoxin subunit